MWKHQIFSSARNINAGHLSFEKAAEVNPMDNNNYYNQAIVYYKKGEYERAWGMRPRHRFWDIKFIQNSSRLIRPIEQYNVPVESGY